jgi:glycosyltransferase involved in cell wall biosynthesis
MAAGLPVLVSNNVGISREVELDECGIVTGIEAESIAAGLVALASQASQLKTMGENARRAAAGRYDIKATAKKVERAYLDILEGIQTPELYWSNGRTQ